MLALLETPLDSLQFDEASDVAMALDERGGSKNFERAAALFEIAERSCPPDRDSQYYRCRRVLALAKAGKWDEAEPTLIEMAEARIPLRDGLGSNFFELAIARLMDHAIEAQDRRRFMEIWNRARKIASEKFPDSYFPVGRPIQDMALAASLDWKLTDVLAQLLDVIEKHRPANTILSETEAHIQQARSLLSR